MRKEYSRMASSVLRYFSMVTDVVIVVALQNIISRQDYAGLVLRLADVGRGQDDNWEEDKVKTGMDFVLGYRVNIV